MRRAAALIAMLLLPHLLQGATERYVIQSGHTDSVTEIAFTKDKRTLASISIDGTLRIWSHSTRKLLHRIQVSSIPLVKLILHPSKPQAAIIESDGLTTFKLSVWDWELNRRLFARELGELPLYIDYSPKGTYLAYSVADWQSVTVLSSRTGIKLPYLLNGFGIVGSFRISGSEERIVTYLPSGTLQYRSFRSGNLIQEFDTLPDLTETFYTLSNRYMVGRWQESIIAIDLLSGDDIDSVSVQGIQRLSVDETTGDTLIYLSNQVSDFGLENNEDDDGRDQFKLYAFSARGFIARYSMYRPPELLSSNLVLRGGALFCGGVSGTIYYQQRYSNIPRIFSQNRLLRLYDIVPSSSIIITSEKKIITVYSDYLLNRPSSFLGNATNLVTFFQDNPLQAPTKVYPFADNLFALKDASDEKSRFVLFSPIEGAIEVEDVQYENPIVSMDTRYPHVLTVDTGDVVKIFNVFSKKFEFSYSTFGLETAIFAHDDNVVAAGRRSQTLRTSRYLINTTTGETVPFADESLITFQLQFEPLSQTLYTLSIEGTSSSPKTVLTAYTGPIFEKTNVLYSLEGEHRNATMAVRRGILFFSINGQNRALFPGSRRFLELGDNNNIPIAVDLLESWFISLNRDSSITIWNSSTGRKALDFYLFEDLKWAVVTSGGEVHSSGRWTDYVAKY
ncbi:MAG: hypothetical protein CMN78_00700 [Spirochaetales bacterium]|nr:hypothetical protein [Spirochaetales bacterium]